MARMWALLVTLAVGATGQASSFEGEVRPQDLEPKRVYSPYAGREYPDRVLFGDLHFHTNLSVDAGLVGTTLTPSDGFRFARGEKMISNTGQPVQLVRPLDFLAITDHAEMMGLAPSMQSSDPLLLADPWGRHINDLFNSGEQGRMQGFAEILDLASVRGINPFSSEALTRSIWSDVTATAPPPQSPRVF